MRVLLIAVLVATIAVLLWMLRDGGTSVAQGAQGTAAEVEDSGTPSAVLERPAAVAEPAPRLAPSGRRVPVEGSEAEVNGFFVRVLHELDGTPLAGAEVRTRGAFAHEPRRTDEDGLVRLDGVPLDGATRIRVEAEGFTPGAARCEGEHSAPELARTIRLRPTAGLAVGFTDTTGRPVPRIFTRVRLPEHSAWPDSVFEHPDVFPELAQDVEWSAVAGSDGIARFDGLPAGVRLLVSPVDGEPHEVELAPGARSTLEIVLDLATRITGRVRDEHGRPAVGARVGRVPRWGDWVPNGAPPNHAGVRTDEEGRYDLFRVEPGEYWLTHAVEKARGNGQPPAFAIEPVAVDVTGEVGVIEVDLEAWSDSAISGTVLGAQERVVSIELRGLDAPDPYLSVSTREGRFRTGALLPGNYLLRAGQYGETVQARPGEDSVVLRTRPLHRLRGRVLGAESVKMNSVWILRREDEWSRTWAPMAGVRRDGTFETQVDEGAYTLLATFENGDVALTDVQVAAAMAEVELAPAPSGEVTLRNDLAVSVYWNFLYTWVPVHEGDLEPGQSTTVRAPAGTYRVTWGVTGEPDPVEREREVEVVVGASRVIRLGEKAR